MNTQIQSSGMTTKWRYARKAVMPLLATLMLVGCGVSATPSESDAKKQLEMLFKNCDLISVHDFKKINGVQQPDGSYRVSIEYKLRSTPSSESRKTWEEFLQQKAAYPAKRKQGDDELRQVKSIYTTQQAALNSIRDRESPEYQEALLKVQSTNNTLKEMQNALWDEERIVAGREDRLEKELGPVYFQQCKVPASLGSVLLGLIGEKAEAFGTVKEKAYRDEFRLVKTDKGWFLPINVAR